MSEGVIITFSLFGVIIVMGHLITAMIISDAFLEIKLLRRQINRLRENFISTNYQRGE